MLKARTPLIVTLVGLVLTLAACQDPPPVLTFEGVSVTEGVEQPLILTVHPRGDRLVGEYRVRAAKGTFAGTVVGEEVTAELTPAPSCTYVFGGLLTGTALTGSFVPSACPGGQAGSWNLEPR